jgi:hypothetical protein
MDSTQALKDAENSLRDFIALVLGTELGADWVKESGVPAERLEKWQARKVEEFQRQGGGAVDERLIYYADFYDLKTILKRHWQRFSAALGDWKTMEVWLTELERLRDPDAHRRELLPHQVHLAIGISGEIRTRIVRYRSKQDTPTDYFPRIESARDSLGNIWVPGSTNPVQTKTILRPGDQLDYVVTASDPLGEPLRYGYAVGRNFPIDWSDQPTSSLRVLPEHIGVRFKVCFYVASKREHHASQSYDDSVDFVYSVLPERR